MALIFCDGFDKYGPANTNSTSVAALMAGEWNTITAAGIAAPLSATGQAVTGNGAGGLVSKTLPASLGRIIGGMRFSGTLASAGFGIQFNDGASNQAGFNINTTGTISLRNGGWSTGTVIATSTAAISANTTHYIEWDISFSNSAAYNIYLDGVSILSGTADTTATANNSISSVIIELGNGYGTADDFYLFDSTSTTNNAPLLTSPRIETTVPLSDSAVQFSVGASVLGGTVTRVTTGNYTSAANAFYLRPFIPARSCTLNSISWMPALTNATVNIRPIVYTDSAGVPSTLMSAGSTVTGTTSGAVILLPLTTPQSLTAGTQYWLGAMIDTAQSSIGQAYDGSLAGRTATSTFASGAPGTAPTTTAGGATVLLWGNITLASAANYYEVSQSPPPAANQSYVTDTTVGHEDLYNFPSLSAIPASVYAVAVKAYCERSDSGARTVSLRVSSSGTDSGGSSTGQTPGTSYAWIGSYFPTDPNGSIAWTGANLNIAKTGFKIDT